MVKPLQAQDTSFWHILYYLRLCVYKQYSCTYLYGFTDYDNDNYHDHHQHHQ